MMWWASPNQLRLGAKTEVPRTGMSPSRCSGLQLQHQLVPGGPARRLASRGSQFLKTSLNTQVPPEDTCRHRGLSLAWVPSVHLRGWGLPGPQAHGSHPTADPGPGVASRGQAGVLTSPCGSATDLLGQNSAFQTDPPPPSNTAPRPPAQAPSICSVSESDSRGGLAGLGSHRVCPSASG